MSNELVKCEVCGEEIAKKAKICPKCGAKTKKKNVWLIVGIIVAVLIIFAAVSGSNEPKLVDTNNPSPANQTTKTTFNVGETAELNDIVVSLVDVKESTGSTYNKPKDGNVFLLCEFEIANNSKSEITVSSMLSFEAYCDDYTCTYSLSALIEKGNKNQLDGNVAPGKKFNGVIGYEVPADWKEMEIHFTPDFWNGKDFTFVATK